jgi:1,4-alpha-glucan branching enzyme
MWYAFTENFILPLSHDEVVYGKRSLLDKMPGDEWQKFANLRLLLAYQFSHPGKKLLFMGDELGEWNEWNHEASLDWNLLDYPRHAGIQRLVKDLNNLCRAKPALHELDCEPDGFQWIDMGDVENSVLSFVRKGASPGLVLAVFNLTPVPRQSYRVGVPKAGFWKEILNSDAREYGGSGQRSLVRGTAESVPWHGKDYSVSITLPPLAAVLFESA